MFLGSDHYTSDLTSLLPMADEGFGNCKKQHKPSAFFRLCDRASHELLENLVITTRVTINHKSHPALLLRFAP